MIVRELVVSYRPHASSASINETPMRTPRDIVPVVSALLSHEPQEVFGVLLLDSRHRVIAYRELHRGTINSTLVRPAEVFQQALLVNAAAMIVCHNHPSGDPSPSPDDNALTRRLAAAAVLMEVPLLDHVIIGADDAHFYSYKQDGVL